MWSKRTNPNEWIEWTFDKCMTNEQIVKMMREEMAPGGNTANKLFNALSIKKNQNDEWGRFLQRLSTKIPDMIKRVEG